MPTYEDGVQPCKIDNFGDKKSGDQMEVSKTTRGIEGLDSVVLFKYKADNTK